MKTGGQVEGGARVRELLRQVGETADQVVRDNVLQSLQNVEAGARARCPVRSGELRDSIRQQVGLDGLDGEVGTDKEYAPHVHFGTGAAGQASSAGQEWAGGGSYDTTRAGQPATPFLFDAIEAEGPEFIARLERDLQRELERIGDGTP